MTAPEINACLNLLTREYTTTGKKARIENGQPRITPTTETATAMAYFSKSNNPDERLMAYIENELGRKPSQFQGAMNQQEIRITYTST